MRATAVALRDFRNYGRAELELREGLTILAGPNGAGKTNMLEAVAFGCTGRSPRTANERELVRRGQRVARVSVSFVDDEGRPHRTDVGFEPGEEKTIRMDGVPVPSLSAAERPLVSVFIPDRLELVKGAPSSRRAHFDQLVAALWPTRAETRTAYSRALAQRNALLGRIRAGQASPDSLSAWDSELGRQGARLMADRAEALEALRPRFEDRATELGLPEGATLRYRPRSAATDAGALATELAERRGADLERGFTAHGPHRDEVLLSHGGESLRVYGSQGQQRVGLLALLFAERDLLADTRGRPPLMLLDDVMSELDPDRRELLAELLRAGGQGLLTTTDAGHVPGAPEAPEEIVEATDLAGRVGVHA